MIRSDLEKTVAWYLNPRKNWTFLKMTWKRDPIDSSSFYFLSAEALSSPILRWNQLHNTTLFIDWLEISFIFDGKIFWKHNRRIDSTESEIPIYTTHTMINSNCRSIADRFFWLKPLRDGLIEQINCMQIIIWFIFWNTAILHTMKRRSFPEEKILSK